MKTILILLLPTIFMNICSATVNGRYYPRYHLAPKYGWMNDPNGFSYFKDEYHLFFQYNPESSLEAGTAHWGHAKSVDLLHWEHLPIALYPDQWYDQNGTFSGSAIVEDDVMYIFYTGNVNITGEKSAVKEYQALAFSTDGVNVNKYENNPILYAESHQPNIRDPKVWKHDDTYYMIIGNSFDNDTQGQVLLYTSQDKLQWDEKCILDKSNGSFGYMWECPDFFELDGKFVFLFSPQGLEPQGDKYRNLYQTGYIIGDFDYDTCAFRQLTEFRELDNGHDVYATQTMIDDLGRRIVVAWVNTWEFVYPDRADGWSGLISLPRILTVTKDLRLLQAPIEEIDAALGNNLYSGKGEPGKTINLPDKTAKVELQWSSSRNIEVYIESQNKSATVAISYDSCSSRVVLDRGGYEGVRRTVWNPRGHYNWSIYIDASSIELICGDGEVTFTSRYFPEGQVSVRLGDKTYVNKYTVNSIKRTVEVPEEF